MDAVRKHPKNASIAKISGSDNSISKAEEVRRITNQKYEITEIAHEKYPFLHRIRALRDIGSEVKAGALGGFVESEDNLSFRPGDDAWLFDDAIACNDAYVDKGSYLRGMPLPAVMPMCPGGPSWRAMPVRRMTPISGAQSSQTMPEPLVLR